MCEREIRPVPCMGCVNNGMDASVLYVVYGMPWCGLEYGIV